MSVIKRPFYCLIILHRDHHSNKKLLFVELAYIAVRNSGLYMATWDRSRLPVNWSPIFRSFMLAANHIGEFD